LDGSKTISTANPNSYSGFTSTTMFGAQTTTLLDIEVYKVL
jgi:hypothetical protein